MIRNIPLPFDDSDVGFRSPFVRRSPPFGPYELLKKPFPVTPLPAQRISSATRFFVSRMALSTTLPRSQSQLHPRELRALSQELPPDPVLLAASVDAPELLSDLFHRQPRIYNAQSVLKGRYGLTTGLEAQSIAMQSGSTRFLAWFARTVGPLENPRAALQLALEKGDWELANTLLDQAGIATSGEIEIELLDKKEWLLLSASPDPAVAQLFSNGRGTPTAPAATPDATNPANNGLLKTNDFSWEWKPTYSAA